jgi:hypothetical protein
MIIEKQYYTVKQLAKMFDMAPKDVRRALKNRGIKINHGSNRRWQIPITETSTLYQLLTVDSAILKCLRGLTPE